MFSFILKKPAPERILHSQDLFWPVLKYQQAWFQYCHQERINPQISAWKYLQKYLMPLIKTYASSYHVEGIRLLKLDKDEQPDFDDFSELFYQVSNGFEIHQVKDEIDPIAYFSLIKQKKFPCIKRLRSHHELFCADEPDFWHEAIGHIAALCFYEVQALYMQIADYMLSAQNKREYQHHLAVAWTMTEYGFIKEQNQNKMFGAALVGSHLAHMRYTNGLIAVEPATREAIIESGFYEEHSTRRRDNEGRLRFFCLENLDASSLFQM